MQLVYRAAPLLPTGRRAWAAWHDVARGGLEPFVELDLPVPARERVAGTELADVRLDGLTARHPHDQLRVGATRQRRVHRRWKRPAEARVHVGDAKPDLGVAEGLHRAGPAHGQRLADRPAEFDQLAVGDHRALDRLATARFDHRARDRVEAAAVEVTEDVDRELGAAHQPLDHHRLLLLDVPDEELHLLAVCRRVDRARAGPASRL